MKQDKLPKITKRFIENEVLKMDSKLNKKEESFKVGCILLTSAIVGTDRNKIAELLKINPDDITKYERRLRKNKIWVKNKVFADWMDEKYGGIAFWCDVCVALGLIQIAKDLNNSRAYIND